MRVDNPDDYKLMGFEVSNTSGKKYDAILRHKTGKLKRVPFGDINSEHFKDSTPNGIYDYLNHNNPERRRLFHLRHAKNAMYKYSSAYFSLHYLW